MSKRIKSKVEVYDNNGRTFDRYTVLVFEKNGIDVFTMSENALDYNGFNQYSHSCQHRNEVISDDEKQVDLKTLPDKLQVAIESRAS